MKEDENKRLKSMKINIKVITTLIILIILSAIFPVIYHYKDKNIQTIPDYVSYEVGIIDSLPKLISRQAKMNQCKGVIIPIKEIKGDDRTLDYIRGDINIGLCYYKDWILSPDHQTEEEMKSRFQQKMKDWGGIIDGDEIERILHEQRNALPDYSATVKINKIDSQINDVRLIICIFDEETMIEIFRVSLRFTHPETLKKIQTNIHQQRAKLSKLEKTADVSLKILYVLVALLILYILVVGFMSIYLKYQIGKTKKYLLSEIKKKDNLVNDGHFVTALELADRYLKYFPHDIEINAFRERLLDFTNNDPKKAQQAFLEAIRLQKKLKIHAQDFEKLFLTEQEKNDLTPLLPYNPELESYYKKITNIEDQEIKKIEFRPKINDVRSLIDRGSLKEAERQVIELLRDYPDYDELQELSSIISEKQDYYTKKFGEVEKQIIKGELASAIEQLEDILKNYCDMDRAVELKELIEKNKGYSHIRLISDRDDHHLELFLKQEVVVGREDIDVKPDIILDDKRISRPHLRISIVDDNVIAEDQNSTGGTFINAEKILSEKLKHGDMITLSKIIDFSVQILKDEEHIKGVVLNSGSKHYVMILEKIKGSFKNRKFDFGLEEFSIYNHDGLCVVVIQDDYYILSPNQEISLQNKKFTVEVIS